MTQNLILNPALHPSGPAPAGVYPSGGSGTVTMLDSGGETFARWTCNATGSGFSCGMNLHPALGVTSGTTPGSTYSGHVRMRHSRAHRLRAYFQFLQGFTMLDSVELGDIPTAGQWVTYQWDGLVAPANTTAIRLLAYQSTSGLQVGDTLDISQVAATPTPTATYFSGDTPAAGNYTYAWDGTPHNSTSTRTDTSTPTNPSNVRVWTGTEWASTLPHVHDGTAWRPATGAP